MKQKIQSKIFTRSASTSKDYSSDYDVIIEVLKKKKLNNKNLIL